MLNVIGRCSLCGGNVGFPKTWYSTNPPVPECMTCGATKKNDLPVIEMEGGRFAVLEDFKKSNPEPKSCDCGQIKLNGPYKWVLDLDEDN